MTVSEFYTVVGGSYSDACGRLMNDRMIVRFLGKFPADPSYAQLKSAFSANDTDAAFRAAHTLKGVSYNLALTALGDAASVLTEALRPGHEEQRTAESLSAMMQAVDAAYLCTSKAIEKLIG